MRATFDPGACWDRELSRGPRDAVARLLGGTVVDWRQLVAGNSRTTWAADVRRGEELLRVVARVDAGDGPFSGTPYTLAREAAVYRALQGRGVALPAVHGYDTRHNLLALSRVTGDPAWDQVVLAALLRELRALHAIDPDTLALEGVGRSARAELELWADIATARIDPPSPFVEFAVAFLRERFPGEPPRLAVVHGDPGPGNLLWDGQRITALLDWEMSHLGDPIDDLAFLTVRLAMHGIPVQEFGRLVAEHYGSLDPDGAHRLRYWQAVSVMRNLIICLSSVSNPVRGRERLVHWMLIPALGRLLMRTLATLAGLELAAPEPPPPAPALPGSEVLRALATELDGLVGAIQDPERHQRARRAGYLLNQLAETWTLAPLVAARRPATGTGDDDERLRELADDADRQLWLFPRARALGEVVLPGVRMTSTVIRGELPPLLPEAGIVRVQGCDIRWYAGGAGSPTLVLIHGGGAHAGWWEPLLDELSARQRVLALDLSGHGDSGHRPAGYPSLIWVEEIAAVLLQVIGPSALIGHSLGGRLATTVAGRHPSLVDSLVTLDSVVPPYDGEPVPPVRPPQALLDSRSTDPRRLPVDAPPQPRSPRS